MFKNIMVPLDGSRLSEAVLPTASWLASATGATVTLLHVLERNAPATIHGERHLTRAAEAESYLTDLARRVFPAGVKVICHVHTAETRDVVLSIAEHESEMAPDLIVMCTHGWGGVRTLLFGSIAQQVVATGKVPILLIRPAEGEAADFVCRHILAPFDGNSAHAAGLELAAELAKTCSAELHVVFVVPTFGTLAAQLWAAGRLLPAASRVLLDVASADARTCIADWIRRLQGRGLEVTGEVRRGGPARVIARAADARQADLIVLATHGKAGTRAFWAESMAQKILNRSRRPMLLVPIRPAENGNAAY